MGTEGTCEWPPDITVVVVCCLPGCAEQRAEMWPAGRPDLSFEGPVRPSRCPRGTQIKWSRRASPRSLTASHLRASAKSYRRRIERGRGGCGLRLVNGKRSPACRPAGAWCLRSSAARGRHDQQQGEDAVKLYCGTTDLPGAWMGQLSPRVRRAGVPTEKRAGRIGSITRIGLVSILSGLNAGLGPSTRLPA